MKIALIGAQGVGKTTLSQALLKMIPDAYLVKETVRECPYPCDKDADFKTEWWVLSHSILAEQEARESNSPLIITDRCLLDIAVYTKLINESNNGRISNLQRQMIENTIDSWLSEDPYDVIFYIHVDPTVWKSRDLDDGFRSVDPNWYEILGREFQGALERFGVSKRTQLVMLENNGAFNETFTKLSEALRLKGLSEGSLKSSSA